MIKKRPAPSMHKLEARQVRGLDIPQALIFLAQPVPFFHCSFFSREEDLVAAIRPDVQAGHQIDRGVVRQDVYHFNPIGAPPVIPAD